MNSDDRDANPGPWLSFVMTAIALLLMLLA